MNNTKNKMTRKYKCQNCNVQDSREKIVSRRRDNIRENRNSGFELNKKVFGTNIQRTTKRNGKISLSTVARNDNSNFKMAIAKDLRLIAYRSTSSKIFLRRGAIIPQPESHAIIAATKTKVVVPARIVVSNLQRTVSQEDIKEIFEDVGELVAAILIAPGVAEVKYKNLKDAQKAVDTYHNIRLDGQLLKCYLVKETPDPALPKEDMKVSCMIDLTEE